jgi:hypothetical protein
VEKLSVNSPGNGDAAGFSPFLIQLSNDPIGKGDGDPQLLCHFVDTHKNLISHNKYLPFFVDRFCLLILFFIKTSSLATATFFSVV